MNRLFFAHIFKYL